MMGCQGNPGDIEEPTPTEPVPTDPPPTEPTEPEEGSGTVVDGIDISTVKPVSYDEATGYYTFSEDGVNYYYDRDGNKYTTDGTFVENTDVYYDQDYIHLKSQYIEGYYENSGNFVSTPGTLYLNDIKVYSGDLGVVRGAYNDNSYPVYYDSTGGGGFNNEKPYAPDRTFTVVYLGEDNQVHYITFNLDGTFTRSDSVTEQPPSNERGSVVPVMTSNTTPTPYVVSSQTIYSSGYDVYRAFDKQDGTYWSAQGVGTADWISIDLGSSKNVDSYAVQSNSSAPSSWRLQGSDDNSNWVDLDSQSGLSFTTKEIKTFQLDSNAFYRYYRLDMDLKSGGRLSIIDLDLIGTN